MKKLILLFALVAFIVVPSIALAGRFEQNPDHIPSIGLSVGLGGEGGSLKVISGFVTTSQDFSRRVFDLSLDFRNPVSESLTWFGGLSLAGSTSEADETALLNGQESDSFGVFGRIGLRIYFQ